MRLAALKPLLQRRNILVPTNEAGKIAYGQLAARYAPDLLYSGLSATMLPPGATTGGVLALRQKISELDYSDPWVVSCSVAVLRVSPARSWAWAEKLLISPQPWVTCWWVRRSTCLRLVLSSRGRKSDHRRGVPKAAGTASRSAAGGSGNV